MSRPHFVLLLLACLLPQVASSDDSTGGGTTAVSYYEQIRPIFQANCQGCHQPAKANGEYVMTAFDRLVKGGESEERAIVAGNPDESYLVTLITPTDGEAEMPQGKPPLSETEIALIRNCLPRFRI